MNRRGFLEGILAAGVAPYVQTAAGVLMSVKKILSLDAPMTATEVLALEKEFYTVVRTGLPSAVWSHLHIGVSPVNHLCAVARVIVQPLTGESKSDAVRRTLELPK